MRRVLALLAVLVAAAATFVSLGASGGGSGTYRVDALFDNADFLVSGQDVKIAGAVVGDVTGVHVTPQHKARVQMEIQKGFAPFRSDASCTIRPESLIGEKFVDCDPGTPKGSALAKQHGQAPTVPLANDHSPVDVDLVLSALRQPYRERLALVVNELGTGLAGRPADLNAAVRRANPALQQANRVLTILDSDRQTLGRLVDASDRVVAQLARHHGDVADFIDRANAVSQTVASRRGDLGEAIRRLPPLLAQLQPASQELAGFASDARPVANDLRVAAPSVNAVLGDLPALNDAALPTLGKLSDLAKTGRRAVRDATPVANALLPVAQRLPEVATLARSANLNLKARGVVEGLLGFVYLATSATARFDQFSHVLPSYQISGTCQQYATAPQAGCSANWNGGSGTGAQKAQSKARNARARRPKTARHRRHRRGSRRAPATPTPTPQHPNTPTPPRNTPTPPAPSAPSLPHLPIPLLNYLLSP